MVGGSEQPTRHQHAACATREGLLRHLGDGLLRRRRISVRLVPQPHIQQRVEGVVTLLVAAGRLRPGRRAAAGQHSHLAARWLSPGLGCPSPTVTAVNRSVGPGLNGHDMPARQAAARSSSKRARLQDAVWLRPGAEALVRGAHDGPRVPPHLQTHRRLRRQPQERCTEACQAQACNPHLRQ